MLVNLNAGKRIPAKDYTMKNSEGKYKGFFQMAKGGSVSKGYMPKNKFADGGEAGKKSIKKPIRKKPQPKMVRQYFEDRPYSYAKGGSVSKGYNVFNYTDDIYATDEVFKTKKLANDFIKEFRSRFSKQGYYRDNQMNKIDVKDIDLLAIPSDFNPFGKAI